MDWLVPVLLGSLGGVVGLLFSIPFLLVTIWVPAAFAAVWMLPLIFAGVGVAAGILVETSMRRF